MFSPAPLLAAAFSDERIQFAGSQHTLSVNRPLDSGHSESDLKEQSKGGKNQAIANHIYEAICRPALPRWLPSGRKATQLPLRPRYSGR
jgi:hypothetical protein